MWPAEWLSVERTERFYKIQRLLQANRAPSKQFFLDRIEVSEPTFKRLRGQFTYLLAANVRR